MRSPPLSKAHHAFGDRLKSREQMAPELDAPRSITLDLRRPVPRQGGLSVRAPKLLLDPPLPLPGRKIAMSRIALFTATTKMRCGSFSLPAGPPSIGGTCPASAIKPAAGHESEWICRGCYATTGNYVFASVQAVQALRRDWVSNALREGTFVDQMSWAMAQFLTSPRTASIDLPGGKGKARVELSRSYFRIHDAGDFSWAGPEYVHAWAVVASRFPSVIFWAPTRDWVFPKMMPSLKHVPRNLVIRPSALYLGGAAPQVGGLAAGTTVSFNEAGGVWDCPAYAHEEHSCESAHCRTCWTHPGTEVNYKPHGTIKQPQLVPLRVRKNPGPWIPTLGAMLASYRQTVRRNPSVGESQKLFPAWMAAKGVPPSAYTERDWDALLARNGMTDVDDQAEYLESIAEWG